MKCPICNTDIISSEALSTYAIFDNARSVKRYTCEINLIQNQSHYIREEQNDDFVEDFIFENLIFVAEGDETKVLDLFTFNHIITFPEKLAPKNINMENVKKKLKIYNLFT